MNIQHVHISGNIRCECTLYFTVYNDASIQLYSRVHPKMKNSVITCSPTCRWHVGWVLLFTEHLTNQLEIVRPHRLGCMLTLFGIQKFINDIFSNQFRDLWAPEDLYVLLLSFKNVSWTVTFHRHGDQVDYDWLFILGCTYPLTSLQLKYHHKIKYTIPLC